MTTYHLRVLDRWDMSVEVDPEGRKTWFADWAVRSPRDAGRHLRQLWFALTDLKSTGYKPRSVIEYFGGLGALALMVEELWPGRLHLVQENSPAAVQHLQSLDLGSTVIEWCDSYTHSSRLFNLQLGDFGDLTAHKMATRGRHRDLLDAMFAASNAVVLTDAAGKLFHLHSADYSAALDVDHSRMTDYPAYLRAVHDYVKRRWGYYPMSTYHQRWSAVTVYTPSPTRRPVFQTLPPETGKGLKILGTG